MALNIFTPHLAPLGRYVWTKLKRSCSKVDRLQPIQWPDMSPHALVAEQTLCTPSSQREMNDLYTGPDFHLSIRYAQLLNSVFVTVMYSSGETVRLCCTLRGSSDLRLHVCLTVQACPF